MMQPPTPGGVRRAVLFDRIWRAWTVQGPVPAYHEAAKDRLRIEWPTLAEALDDLAEEMARDEKS